MTNRNHLRGLLALIAMALTWGAMAPLAKAAIEGGIPQSIVTCLRMWGCCVLFTLWSATLPKQKVCFKDLMLMALAGLLGIVGDQGLFILGLSMASPVDGAVISFIIPVFTFVLSIVFLKQKTTLRKAIGIALGFIGAALMVLSTTKAGDKSGSVLGDIIIIIAMFSFSSYLIFFADLIKKYRIDVMMKWMFLAASVYVAPIFFYELDVETLSQVGLIPWSELLYVIVGGTFVPFLCMCVGQNHFTPETVSVFNYLQPVVGCTLAVWMGLTSYGLDKFIAAAFIFVAVWLVVQKGKSKQAN